MKLPFLISVPHGGMEIPNEIREKVIISKRNLFHDGDAYTRDIYFVKDLVKSFHSQSIARAFIDLNRDPQDRPPKNPDGVIKTLTCYNKEIYDKDWISEDEINLLLKNYYYTYHEAIQTELSNPELKFAFDCHSMASISPNIAPDLNQERPLFCLSNNLNKTSSEESLLLLQDIICKVFKIEKSMIWINKPFLGGYLTRKFGNNPLPWIQIEMNRKLYLDNIHFNENTLEINKKRLPELNNLFRQVLIQFNNQLSILKY